MCYFRIMNVIRKYLPCLTNLDVSHSCITDKGLRHLMSPLCVLHRPDQPNPNIIRNLTSFLDSPERVYSSNFSKCMVFKILASRGVLYIKEREEKDTSQNFKNSL